MSMAIVKWSDSLQDRDSAIRPQLTDPPMIARFSHRVEAWDNLIAHIEEFACH
jgi:hypothetical protein